MADTAKRFAATRGQNGTAMGKLSDAMKDVAAVIDKWWDPSEPGVVSAVQHFEQGLARLKVAAPEGYISDDEGEPVKKATRKPAAKPGESTDQEAASTE
jgi:hypothetical protein